MNCMEMKNNTNASLLGDVIVNMCFFTGNEKGHQKRYHLEVCNLFKDQKSIND